MTDPEDEGKGEGCPPGDGRGFDLVHHLKNTPTGTRVKPDRPVRSAEEQHRRHKTLSMVARRLG